MFLDPPGKDNEECLGNNQLQKQILQELRNHTIA